MQIPTSYEAEAMAMARRVQQSIRLSMIESEQKQDLAESVVGIVSKSCSNN